MSNVIYESERKFHLYDVSISHGQILLRSKKEENYSSNIDIIFFDTAFIQLPTILYGISIEKANKNIESGYLSVRSHLNFPTNFLFEIKSKDESFFICASFVHVFENKLDLKESSLNYNFKQEERIASSKDE